MNKLFENWRSYLSEANPATQEMRDRIATHQGVEPTAGRSGREIADERDPDSYFQRKAEGDGFRDFKDDGDRGDHWEKFEDGKYLQYW